MDYPENEYRRHRDLGYPQRWLCQLDFDFGSETRHVFRDGKHRYEVTEEFLMAMLRRDQCAVGFPLKRLRPECDGPS